MNSSDERDLHLEGLVHDLNNVFETISEAADLLAADPSWEALAATIQRSIERGKRIVGSYREARGVPDLDDILDLAVEFTDDFLSADHRPKIEFRRRCEPGILLPGTAAAWERVLVNLFLNAAQAMQRGGCVEIVAHHNDDAVQMIISDEGPGIPEDILTKIFTPRFSTKSARSGLGLHIVQSIVTQYGGTVTAGNRPDGRGAVFSIRLPNT